MVSLDQIPTHVMFLEQTMELPQKPLLEWPDETLIAFIDEYEKELAGLGDWVTIAYNPVDKLFFAAWLELHKRTEP